MTREETCKILAIIASTYPNFKPENKKQTVDAWEWALEEYDYKSISLALKAYITTSDGAFAPSVSQLIAMTRKTKELTTLSEGEAWAMVRVAVRNGLYGAEEEFSKLPKEVQKAVGSASMIRQWAMADSSDLDTVIGSNFMRSYKTIVKREQEKEALPAEIRTLIESTNNKMLEVKD